MGDADKSLKVLIVGEEQVRPAAAAAKAEMKAVAAAAEEANKAKQSKDAEYANWWTQQKDAQYKEEQDNLKYAEVAHKELTESVIDGTKKQKDAAGGLGKAFSGAWGGIRMLANIIPGLGISGIFLAAATAVGWFISKLREAKEDMTEYYRRLDAVRSVSDEAALANRGFADELAKVIHQSDGVFESLDKQNGKIDEQKAALIKVIEKQKELSLAKAEFIQDPVERAQRKAEIEGKSIDEVAAVEKKALQQKMIAEKKAVEEGYLNFQDNKDAIAEGENKWRDLLSQKKLMEGRADEEEKKYREMEAGKTMGLAKDPFYIEKMLAQKRVADMSRTDALNVSGALQSQGTYLGDLRSKQVGLAGEYMKRYGQFTGTQERMGEQNKTIDQGAAMDKEIMGTKAAVEIQRLMDSEAEKAAREAEKMAQAAQRSFRGSSENSVRMLEIVEQQACDNAAMRKRLSDLEKRTRPPGPGQ